jgi:hypothetical protein
MQVFQGLRRHKIKSRKEIFEIVSHSNNFQELKISDEKGRIHEAISIAPEQAEFEQGSKKHGVGRGYVIEVMISRGKNRIYKKRIITDILKVKLPVQLDLEDILKGVESNA